MATLRAFLRGQAIDQETDLGAVIANLNRLVFESSAPNRYATFFLGVFDAASRVLNYVNAGHKCAVGDSRGRRGCDAGGGRHCCGANAGRLEPGRQEAGSWRFAGEGAAQAWIASARR